MWLIFTLLAKLITWSVKLTGKGSGYTFPGYLILKIYPNILKRVTYEKGIILISGTNGKTTTTKLITHLITKSGCSVTTNSSGSNLLRGIVTSVLLDTNILGKPRGDYGVFEVDEFNLPVVLSQVTPKVLLLLNLSRDQLDRYGETDIIFEKWKDALSTLKSDALLIADLDQKEFKELPGNFKGKISWFDSASRLLHHTKLLGEFNAKNINAAILALENLGYDKDKLITLLPSFTHAYGRGEFIEKDGKKYQIYLAKNPASFNHNLDLFLLGHLDSTNLVFVLNDNQPDGRDVSWIYDIDREKLAKVCESKRVYVSGTRYLDMAVRLHYAGIIVNEYNIGGDLSNILSKPEGHHITVLPNYSAMLETREILMGRKIL